MPSLLLLLLLEDFLARCVIQFPPSPRPNRDTHDVAHLAIVFQDMEVLVPDVLEGL